MRIMIPMRSRSRIRAPLFERLPQAEPLWMDDEGRLQLDAGPHAGEQACTPVQLPQAAPIAAWANTDLYLGGPARDFMVACLKSQSLRFVQSSAAGFEHPVFRMLCERGIRLSNSDAAAISIAEFVVASVFDVFQPQALRRQLQATRQWRRTPFREVHGTTWLIVGFGNIGREVAVRARTFGARVIGVRRTPRGDEPAERMLTPDALPEAVSAADVVALCAPANASTHHLVDARLLARLKTDSVLINIGRGSLIDEAALLESLERGRPGTAVLDVFAKEPLPEDSPLWLHPRVRVSAHNAANGDGFERRNDELFLDNVARLAAGQPLRHLVDPQRLG